MKKLQDFPYKTSFAFNINKIVNDEVDKYISKAGLEKLKPLMPKDIDLEKNPDFIACVLNAAVAGRTNLNGDAITGETAVNIAKNFINKFVDSSHDRNRCIGVIVNYGYSKFGNNEIITEEEASKSKEPFNISLAILLWKSVLNNEFINLLENSADPTSADYGRLSGSWELYFSNYDIGVGSKNINDAEIVADEKKKEELEKYLQVNGGKGKKDDKFVYRIIKANEENYLIPAGIGLVEVPAAEVKGLEIVNNKQDTQAEIIIEANNKEKSQECFTKEKLSVIKTNKTNKNIMTISKITDITDENLKECKASAVVDFISEELKKADVKWKEQEELAKNAQAEKLKVEANLTKIQEDLKKLQDIQAAKESEEIYTQRMTYFDDTYELSKEERQAIAAEVKDADKDAFEKAKSKFDIFLKDKSKAAIKAKNDEVEAAKKKMAMPKEHTGKEDCSCAKCKTKESKASVNNEEVIDEALKNGTQANAALPNAQSSEQTLEAKYAEAFKPENCIEISKR